MGRIYRLIGAIIMVHGDERGLVTPVALQVIIVPIAIHKEGLLIKPGGLPENLPPRYTG